MFKHVSPPSSIEIFRDSGAIPGHLRSRTPPNVILRAFPGDVDLWQGFSRKELKSREPAACEVAGLIQLIHVYFSMFFLCIQCFLSQKCALANGVPQTPMGPVWC